jgi:tetratricopeptide (TPR) repeat protein
MAEEGDDPIAIWITLSNLVLVNQPRALVLAEQFLERQRQAGEERTIATALHELGRILFEGGEYDRARAVMDEAVALLRAPGITWGNNLAHTLADQAIAARFQGDDRQALASFDESVRLATDDADVSMAAAVLLHRGHARLASGDVAAAVADFRQSLTLTWSQQQRSVNQYALVFAALAGAMQVRGRMQRAMRLAGAAAASEAERPVLEANQRFDYCRIMDAARARLDDPVLAAAWAEGQAMTLDQAVAYALQEGEADEPPVR